MKSNKEIVQLIVALVILAVAGYMIYLVLVPQKPKSSSSGATYVQVTSVDPNFDAASLNRLSDGSQIHDFYNPPDLSAGLNNSQPFGPLP